MLERRPAQLVALAVGSGVFLVSAALVRDDAIPAAERSAFELVNGWPEWVSWPLYPVMQFGMVLSPVVAAGVAWALTRRRQPALALATTGLGMWLAAKLVKAVVDRPRPGLLLEDVVLRVDAGSSGLGFVSGHAVLAAVIATIASPYLPRRWAAAIWALAAGAGLSRVYIGAHLPLDSIGGAGLGVAAGAVALLVVRRD
jgi:undecaprenyl-diphosphatase